MTEGQELSKSMLFHEQFPGINQDKLKIVLVNQGLKNPKPLPKADFYIDCRALPDAVNAKLGSGDNPDAQLWMINNTDINPYLDILTAAINTLPTRRDTAKKLYAKPFVVCCFCAWGIHRSRTLKNILGVWLKSKGFIVSIDPTDDSWIETYPLGMFGSTKGCSVIPIGTNEE